MKDGKVAASTPAVAAVDVDVDVDVVAVAVAGHSAQRLQGVPVVEMVA